MPESKRSQRAHVIVGEVNWVVMLFDERQTAINELGYPDLIAGGKALVLRMLTTGER
jgi:hypothetical protein